jgi:SulP family sulfate permease
VNAFWVPPTLRGYRMTWLGADALAALTLVAVALPSQMATARLADLPAVVGLYAFMAGSLLYFLIGSNPHLSVGADSTIAPVLATAATAVAVVGTAHYATTMAFTALLVGALVIAVGLLQLGWVRSSFRPRSSPAPWPGLRSKSWSANSRSSWA